MWEESAKILWKLYQRNPTRHRADLARSLHFHARYLHRAGKVDRAEQAMKQAISLRQQLYDAYSESPEYCSDLVSSLDGYAAILRTIDGPGSLEAACVAKKEVSTLLRKLFFVKLNQHPTELHAFARTFGEFLLQLPYESGW